MNARLMTTSLLAENLTDTRVLSSERPPAPAPEVKSKNERIAERIERSQQTLRRYSLTLMCRKLGIRRSIRGTCKCGRPISANKSACLRCAAK